MPAGELDAPLAHLGIVAAGQRQGEFVDVGALCRLFDLFFARARPAVGNVFADAAAVEEHVLRDDAHAPAQGAAGDVADIDAADGDAAAVYLVKAGNEVADGGLAAARRPDEGDRAPLFDGKAQVREDGRFAALLIVVRKGHVVKDDVAAQKIDGHGMFGLALGGQGEHLAEAREARKAVLDLLEQVDEGAHGSQQHGDVEDEGSVVAGADLIEAEKQPARHQGDEV